MFYTYLWLREDGTPYYAGKGHGRRAYDKRNHRQAPPPKERIVIYPAESETDAMETEVALIWYYGRKDLRTGCLRNLTNGGDGTSGLVRWDQRGVKKSEESKRKASTSLRGRKRPEGWSNNQHDAQHAGRSGHKGVVWDGQSGLWKARHKVNGKRVYVGLYSTVEDAVHALKSL